MTDKGQKHTDTHIQEQKPKVLRTPKHTAKPESPTKPTGDITGSNPGR